MAKIKRPPPDGYAPGFKGGLESYTWRAKKTALLPSERAGINKYVPGKPMPAAPPLPRQERAKPTKTAAAETPVSGKIVRGVRRDVP